MGYSSQFLKWKMETIWNNKGCVSPNHLVRWTEFKSGYQCWVPTSQGMVVVLYFHRGRRMSPKGKRPKGKGFSFLVKGHTQEHWKHMNILVLPSGGYPTTPDQK